MSVSIVDVTPRDGLQIEECVLPAHVRADLVNRLAATGLRRIEAVSFVSPQRVPTMADAERVTMLLNPLGGVQYAGLVLNDRGYERLSRTILTQARLAVACSDTFSQRNTGMTVGEATATALRIIEAAHADGRTVCVTLAVAFGCPFEGFVNPAKVAALADQMLTAGADELVFADTIGVGMPSQVRQLIAGVASQSVPIGVHLHDTRNTAALNAFVAFEAGATVFDASTGGLGGCPFAPGATGNLATEDLVYLFHREGIDTGVDLDALISIAHWLPGVVGHTLTGSLQKAGVPSIGDVYARPTPN